MKELNIESKKCKKIKKLIEEASGIKDIGIRSRKRPVQEFKKFYCKLCKIFTKASLQTIGETLGEYDHATALHAIKTFDNLSETNGLNYSETYFELFERLKKDKSILRQKDEPVHFSNLKDQEEFRISLIKIIEKGHSIINRKEEKVNKLEDLIKNLLELTDPANPKERSDFSKFYSLREEINLFLSKK